MKRKQTNGSAPSKTKCIDYHEAVIRCRELLAQIETNYYSIGQLVYEVAEAAEYGDRTLANFADDLGLSKCVLDRYASVYRTWKDILAPGLKPSYAVLRELAPYATNPEVAQTIQDSPNMTKREALEMKRELKGDTKEERQQEQEDNWRKDNRRWFRELYTHAQEVSRMVEVALDLTPEKQRELLPVIDELLLMNMGGCGRTLVDFVKHFEALIEEAERAEPDEVSAPKRAHSEATVQATAE